MELGTCFILLKDDRWEEEKQEIFDLKSLTKEEVGYFIDFAREQYLVRWDTTLEGITEIDVGK